MPFADAGIPDPSPAAIGIWLGCAVAVLFAINQLLELWTNARRLTRSPIVHVEAWTRDEQARYAESVDRRFSELQAYAQDSIHGLRNDVHNLGLKLAALPLQIVELLRHHGYRQDRPEGGRETMRPQRSPLTNLPEDER